MRKKIKNILINIWFNYSFGYRFKTCQVGPPVLLISISSQFFGRKLIFLNKNRYQRVIKPKYFYSLLYLILCFII